MISIDVNSLNDLAEVEKAIEKLSFVRNALKKAEDARTAKLIEQLKRDVAIGAGLTYAQAYVDWFTTTDFELVEVDACDARKAAPFMDPQEAIQDDGIVCLIDGKNRKFLPRYVRQVHGMEWHDYLNRYDLPANYPQVCKNLLEQCRKGAIDRGFGKHDRRQEAEQQVQVTVPIRKTFGRRGTSQQVSVNIDINGSTTTATTDRQSANELERRGAQTEEVPLIIDWKTEGGVMVRIRNGESAIFFGRGPLGRTTAGRIWRNRDPITWNLEGRWRWDGQDHPLDIIDGFPH